MPGQTLIHEGVFRVQKFEDALITEQHALEQQLRLLNEGLAETAVEVGEDDRVGVNAFRDAKLEPLGAEVGDQVSGAGIGQHAADLIPQNCRIP